MALLLSNEERVKRLKIACERMGGKAALGRALGYKDGAFVGQMLRGDRPITEKTMAALLGIQKVADLFSFAAHSGGFTLAANSDTLPAGAGEPSPSRQEDAASEFTLAQALQVVAEALQDVDEMTRETAAALLSNLAKAPGNQPNIAAAMQALLHFSSSRGVETRDVIKQPEQAK